MTSTSLARSAETLLRTLGGIEVNLLMPGALPNTAAQPESVALAPVVVRNKASGGPPSSPPVLARQGGREVEMLVAAAPAIAAAEARQFTSAEAMFAAALGIQFDGQRGHIIDCVADYFAGAPYLFRLTLVLL